MKTDTTFLKTSSGNENAVTDKGDLPKRGFSPELVWPDAIGDRGLFDENVIANFCNSLDIPHNFFNNYSINTLLQAAFENRNPTQDGN